eukprot:12904511-Prorocentrum_lima.AAC.1
MVALAKCTQHRTRTMHRFTTALLKLPPNDLTAPSIVQTLDVPKTPPWFCRSRTLEVPPHDRTASRFVTRSSEAR